MLQLHGGPTLLVCSIYSQLSAHLFSDKKQGAMEVYTQLLETLSVGVTFHASSHELTFFPNTTAKLRDYAIISQFCVFSYLNH